MRLGFETVGNATLIFYEDGRPVLATDPWLVGNCYFGSWALDRPFTSAEREAVIGAEYIWISHGHPDHLHHESLALLPRDKKLLIPDHYHSELRDFLIEQGFHVEILQYRQWRRLSPRLRCLCLDNENQDGVLVVEADDALVIDLNDSPLCGEEQFIRGLVKTYPRDKTYLAKLCAIDADMLNFIDAGGVRTIEPPEIRKPGMVWTTAGIADRLGVGSYVCSSSQHLYVRGDSAWANPYRIVWPDITANWTQPAIRIIEPFVRIDLETGTYERKHPSQQSDFSQVTDTTAADDYSETLSDAEWQKIVAFFTKIALLRPHFDWLDFVVGGVCHRHWINPGAAQPPVKRQRGITFHAPRRSLVEAIEYGYFDDLLIGNFMKTELHNAKLYPHFTPVVAKLGGNAKVFTPSEYRRFKRRYFRRNPVGYLRWQREQLHGRALDLARDAAEQLGVRGPAKRAYRFVFPTPASTEPHAEGGFRLPAPREYLSLDQFERPTLLVVVDTEEAFDWSAPFSTGYNDIAAMSRIERPQALFERFGVRPAYVVDYPIASQEAAYSHLLPIIDAGRCIIGSQLHPWVNPPFIEELNPHNSFPGNLPRELEYEKLRVLTEAVTRNLGVRPEIYKAGRYGIGPNTVGILRDLGYRIDVSVHAHRQYLAEGGPDFRAIRPLPHWIEGSDVLEIPLSCGYYGILSRWGEYCYDALDTTLGRALHLPGIGARLGLLNRVTISPEAIPLAEAKQLTTHLIARGVKLFTLSFHSASLEPGSTPYVRNESDVDRLLGWIETYLEFFFRDLGGGSSTFPEIRAAALAAAVRPVPVGQ